MKRIVISMLIVFSLTSFCSISKSAGLSQITDVMSIQKELANPDSEDTNTAKINYVAELNKIGMAGRPESDNAAHYYKKAIELYAEKPQGLEALTKQWPKERPARQHAMLKRWVQDNSSALGGPVWMGRYLAVMYEVSSKIMALSMAFLSSRTFPGQS